MKSSTLLQSFLLTTGLVAGGISAAQADQAYTIVPSSFIYNLLQDNYSPGQTPWRAFNHHPPGNSNFCPHEVHSPEYYGNHGRGNGYGHEGRRQHGKHDGRGYGHDHKDHRQHGKHDGRGYGHDHKDHRQHGKHDGQGNRHDSKGHREHGKRDVRDDTGRKGHRSSSAGIGYTGRS